MKKIITKVLPILALLLSRYQPAAAQLRVAETTILQRYALDTLTALPTKVPLLVKFIKVPDEKTLARCGVIKALSGQHYIVQSLPLDSALLKKVQYSYIAGPNRKATDALLAKLESLRATDSITVQLSYTGEHFTSPLTTVVRTIATYRVAVVKVSKKDWPALISRTDIIAADIIQQPASEIIINTINPYVNRINVAQQQFPQVRGKSVTVSVKEDLFDTTDIDLVGRYVLSAGSSDINSPHATIMATLIAGAGNSGIKALGVAPAARLSSVGYGMLYPDDATYYRQFGITVQNHSYGSDTSNRYGAEAAAYDQHILEADTLVHVFSSGNAGASAARDGRYQGLPAYANLTGNYKHAKNVLVVGGTDANFQVSALSSRGPAYDGRIKPEVVAYGQDGTSGAAALTSGIVTLLQDAYRQQHGVAPSSALIKALLINSATLPAGVRPAYTHGYGSLHAAGALATLTAGHYRQGMVTTSSDAAFDIQVPPGLQQVKITLYWNDLPAAPNAAQALINDLDMQVVTADNKSWRPWVLNTFPSLDSLKKPAQRGIDSLNNTEQISIDQPAAGNLHISITKRRLATISQSFYIVYSFETQPSFAWQNPVAGAILLAAQQTPLQWETTYSGNGALSYSTDNGSTWNTIASQVPLQQPWNWVVPPLFSQVLLKLTLTDTSFVSPPCYISPQLTLNTGFNCSDTAQLYWNTLPSATGYQVYIYNQGVMKPYQLVKDSFLFIPKRTVSSVYYAVSPVAPAGWEGARSYAVDYTRQGVGCYVQTLLADKTTDNQVWLSLSLGSTYLLKNIYWERYSVTGWTRLGTQLVSNATNYNFMDSHPYEGIVQYRVALETVDGRIFYSDVAVVNILLQHDILVFPNPVISQLYILDAQPRSRQLVLIDMSGRTVMRRTLSDMQETVSMDRLPPGVYHCSIFLGNQRIYSGKIVKQ
ncbi:S8 family serine peptidase [Chitinophaga flava]|uniref:Peptidase S8/S53 domain-containing protein n=1 Tax=Chitinophaga flava TaxID=2259036 RepID=A0A365XS74_9BACT|nr:S8 family serine peptidase [Chitinophaga flava]RBL89183.1 hypothetical protein DF182_21905 [Chitinophaga flava]